MKLTKTENGVKMEAETAFERECLEKLAHKGVLTAKFEDTWNQTGPVTIEGQPHPWDRERR